MTARLSTHVWIGALRRRVEAAGGFAAILNKGDPDSGSVLLVLRERDGQIIAISQVNTGRGTTSWQKIVAPREDGERIVHEAVEKRRRFDPDLWVVELDVSDPARFIDGDILGG